MILDKEQTQKNSMMKQLVILIFTICTLQLVAQTDYYLKKNIVIGGYDVTSYFERTPKQGVIEYALTYEGAQFYFVTQENKKKFEANPQKYIPQYGGYCAYAIGAKGEKVKIDPETYEIRDGKLYLFYNAWGTNTLDLWNEEGAVQLQAKADRNWENIKIKE